MTDWLLTITLLLFDTIMVLVIAALLLVVRTASKFAKVLKKFSELIDRELDKLKDIGA